jgi:hypothetical protein
VSYITADYIKAGHFVAPLLDAILRFIFLLFHVFRRCLVSHLWARAIKADAKETREK